MSDIRGLNLLLHANMFVDYLRVLSKNKKMRHAIE